MERLLDSPRNQENKKKEKSEAPEELEAEDRSEQKPPVGVKPEHSMPEDKFVSADTAASVKTTSQAPEPELPPGEATQIGSTQTDLALVQAVEELKVTAVAVEEEEKKADQPVARGPASAQ